VNTEHGTQPDLDPRNQVVNRRFIDKHQKSPQAEHQNPADELLVISDEFGHGRVLNFSRHSGESDTTEQL
jgi:hypothetical protein